VQGIDVRFRVNGERPNAELFAGTDHTQGDFTAVRYQDFLEHW